MQPVPNTTTANEPLVNDFLFKILISWERNGGVGGAEGEGVPSGLCVERGSWPGARSHDPEITTWTYTKSWKLDQLYHPGTPGLFLMLFLSPIYSLSLTFFDNFVPNQRFLNDSGWTIVLGLFPISSREDFSKSLASWSCSLHFNWHEKPVFMIYPELLPEYLS